MKISDNKVVVLHYAVSDSEDTLIDSSYDHSPLAVIQGSHYLIPGLEEELVGHEAGDKFEVAVTADAPVLCGSSSLVSPRQASVDGALAPASPRQPLEGKKPQEQLMSTPERNAAARTSEADTGENGKVADDDDKLDPADGATNKDNGGTGMMFTK